MDVIKFQTFEQTKAFMCQFLKKIIGHVKVFMVQNSPKSVLTTSHMINHIKAKKETAHDFQN